MEEKNEIVDGEATTNETPDAAPSQQRGRLSIAAYGCMVIFFGLATLALIAGVITVGIPFYAGANKVDKAIIEPVGDLVQQLLLPVTPVVLPNPATIVREINDLSRLETASYEYEKVITAETRQDVLWGTLGETMVFVAHGKVYAGLDFSKMSVTDLQVYGPQTVQVHLPNVEIFEDIPVLDNDRSFVADRDTGIFTRADPELETQVRQAAEQSIREAASESEILERAEVNAREYMTSFLTGLGFTEIVFTDQPPIPAPPFEQQVPKGFVVTPAVP